MAEPADSSIIQLLTNTELTMEQYESVYREHTHLFDGKVTNRLFRVGRQKVYEDGINIKSEHWMQDTVRPTASPLGENRVLGNIQSRQVKARFDPDTPSSNDFTGFDAAVRVSHLDFKKLTKNPDGVVDLAERLVKQVLVDYDIKRAVASHTAKSGVIATVNGNMIDSETLLEYTGSTYSTGTTVRFKVDGGSIAALRNGTVLLITKSDGTRGVTAQINHVNPVDNSIRVTVTADSAFANFSTTSLYDNGLIYLSNTDTATSPGMYSLYDWFTEPGSGDAFIGGVDRRTVANSYLNPLRYKATSSGTTPIEPLHLDLISEAMQFQIPDDWNCVIMGNTRLINSLRRTLGEAALITDSPKQTDGYNFGSKTVGYQHANLGRVELMSEPLCHPNRLYFIVPQTWQMYHYGMDASLERLSGDVAGTGWSRMQASTLGSGKGKYYQMEWTQPGLLHFCHAPEFNAVLLNVEP